MDLFEKVQIIKEAKEKEEMLQNDLLNQFVKLPYEIKELEETYIYGPSAEMVVKLYFPVLNTPKGFKKENEKFDMCAHTIKHEYSLKDEQGRTITVLEHVAFVNIYKSKDAIMQLNFYIPLEDIDFYITILGQKYRLNRKISHKQLLKEIIGDDDAVKYTEVSNYLGIEKEYEEFLNYLERTEKLITLKELLAMNKAKVQITESISAVISTKIEEKHYHCIWLNNPKYNVRLYNVKYYKTTIKVKPYLNNTIKIEGREFCYAELENEAELRKGKTLDEIIELLESFQTE